MFSEVLTRLTLAKAQVKGTRYALSAFSSWDTCNLGVVRNETMGQDDRKLPSLVPENSFNSLYHDAELSDFVRPLDRILRRGRMQSRLRPFKTLEYFCLATHGSHVRLERSKKL
jgi:hypothetical protein